MSIGRLMLDLDGIELSAVEKEIIAHPQVGGIILFTRNYESKKQLQSLTKSITNIFPECLIAVDQEGGRIQRFSEEFTPLPAFREYGQQYEQDSEDAMRQAERMAYIMANELLEVGVGLSFSPVLDLDRGVSEVIGSRSFHANPKIAIDLAYSFIKGMRHAGMPSTGKHFPGHGAVTADSHLALPIDHRDFDTIYEQDLQPFIHLNKELDGIMPAHILYESIDKNAACFSRFWLQDILRTRLEYTGVIFSDDLNMAGAQIVGDHVQRARLALEAGCDMILICNAREQAVRVIDELGDNHHAPSQERLKDFRSKSKS